MVITEYNPSSFVVKNHVCLTGNNYSHTLRVMTFGERLLRAREFAGLTQGQLSERLGVDQDGKAIMSQSNISALERDPKTKGSLHTLKLARACGVNPDWLAYEEGEMEDGLYVNNDNLKRVLHAAEQIPDYAIDEAIARIEGLVRVLQQAPAPAATPSTDRRRPIKHGATDFELRPDTRQRRRVEDKKDGKPT